MFSPAVSIFFTNSSQISTVARRVYDARPYPSGPEGSCPRRNASMTRLVSHRARSGLLAASLLLSAGYAGAAAGETIDVTLDKAKILKMPPHAETIVIGNPIIADVTTLKNNGLVVVTGKGFGETNLIFLDRAGLAIQEANIRVEAGRSMITVQRGMDRESYSCQPRCEPTVSLGDATRFLTEASSQIKDRNALAIPGGH